jgi:hypothetical protein
MPSIQINRTCLTLSGLLLYLPIINKTIKHMDNLKIKYILDTHGADIENLFNLDNSIGELIKTGDVLYIPDTIKIDELKKYMPDIDEDEYLKLLDLWVVITSRQIHVYSTGIAVNFITRNIHNPSGTAIDPKYENLV